MLPVGRALQRHMFLVACSILIALCARVLVISRNPLRTARSQMRSSAVLLVAVCGSSSVLLLFVVVACLENRLVLPIGANDWQSPHPTTHPSTHLAEPMPGHATGESVRRIKCHARRQARIEGSGLSRGRVG